MTFTDAIILGAVQGLTEFLPISSSGHLVLAQHFLGIKSYGNEIEVLVHLGTLASILVVFSNDIKLILEDIKSKDNQNYIFLLFIASLPAAIIGIEYKHFFESLFNDLFSVSKALLFTGMVLVSSYFFQHKDKNHNIISSILIGLAQALAIVPGISRSGMTISFALLMGINAKEAAKFSFLMAIPVISGAGLLTFMDAYNNFSISLSIGFSALISSFIIGLLALKWLLKWLGQGKLHYFGIYCIILGLVTMAMFI